MKAAFIDKSRSLNIIDKDIPLIKPGEALVKVHMCGVCGTDIHIYEGVMPWAKLPLIPGHELSGVVVDVGRYVDSVSVGDAVTVDPNITCGLCRYCRSAKRNLCPKMESIGVTRDGGFAEYVVVPISQLYRVPSGLSLDEAAFTEPVACCLHGIARLSIKPGEDVLIVGAGPIGLIHLQLAKRTGAGRVIVAEVNDMRLKLAEKLGADLTVNPSREVVAETINGFLKGKGVEVAIDAAGGSTPLTLALNCLEPDGRLLVFGVASENDAWPIKPYDIYKHELTIIGSFINPYEMDSALNLLASGAVDVKPLISHIISLNDLEKALKREIPNTIKILVKP
ncbi:zinc-dependent alcohol dehydrogenase family protein [Candidatus Bathyarchaeota archaeon]|nr:zinc-dependent alcohol dehydrogenase family protein [Candidatus Bathyarchaeota archaeon]MBS7613601.1 zinc-dependent alcohol dehydrogenase family protein [Candidatus Bathyarchaeota archaeon]MBS7618409.1 zinc-dependent alcohol dehydrogenase family protein [Candidatus Bathyarchaeota archaeon]